MTIFAIALFVAWIFCMIKVWSDRVIRVHIPNGGGSVEISNIRKCLESVGVSVACLAFFLSVNSVVNAIDRNIAARAAFEAGWQPAFSCGEHGVVRHRQDTGEWQRSVPAGRNQTSWVSILPPPC
jgi:hypothetical protein